MPDHDKFPAIQAARPTFDPDAGFQKSQPPQMDWKPGQGLNTLPQSQALFQGDKPMRVFDTTDGSVASRDVYKLMCGGIAPRPVALVGTLNEQGVPNLAPISWYQMVSHDPPLVMVSFGGAGSAVKDSDRNIKNRKQFTISSSSEPYVEALNYASIDAPHGVSEFTLAGLTPEPSLVVAPPRVKEAPFALECALELRHEWHNDKGERTTTMVIGRVLRMHIREDCIDEESGTLDPAQTMPVSRFGGMLFARSTIGYDLVRPKFEEEKSVEGFAEKAEDAKKPL
ncbi:hypothetical protein OC846_005352 [Tilletia horrida]|uniref:Flavin reductase like domain-containing protein n=1 Tax=Tilletia horrida TaxID=155126 RepID=A0AAN6GLG9_9BASI|nr:hypothetical protein OC846_005352 [Tilletia horrida]KAK0552756.1 hypothetical protein OC845_001542 [Tilletia horrida]KAK0561985.1 hypothetical protein OC861_005549 [Tilletia horrida]